MTPIKDHIAKCFLGKTFRFTCNCIVNLDITGEVKDYEISKNEIILLILSNNKIIKIGLNTPSLFIEEI